MAILKRYAFKLEQLLIVTLLLVGLFIPGQPARGAQLNSPSGVSLAGVHYYGGQLPDGSYLPDMSVPFGQRGWNVETVVAFEWDAGSGQYVDKCNNGDLEYALGPAWRAQLEGLVNIIRIDYRKDQAGNIIAVPGNSAEYTSWSNSFIRCVARFRSYQRDGITHDLASLFIVGNEPNLDGGISDVAYANAFNHLWGRKVSMVSGTELLAVFNSPFTPPEWMYTMTSRLNGVDGFAFHTGGARPSCQDPRQPCQWADNRYDGAFRFYRDVINQIDQRFWNKPAYITEFNTYTGDPGSQPSSNYPADWINRAFEEIRNYNATRNGRPEIKALIWFIDESRGYDDRFALRSYQTYPLLAQALNDMKEEFRNPANRQFSNGISPRTDVFVRGTDNNLYYRTKTTGSWSNWTSIGSPNGGATSDPSAVSWGQNRIDVFVRGGDNALWHRAYNGSWGVWESLGGYLTSAPDAASWSWGDLEVFVRGGDNKLYQKRFTNGVWSGWIGDAGAPSGGANSAPGVVSWGSGRIDLFVRGGDNALWHRAYFNGWGAWESFGGVLTTGPDAASWGPGHIDVFAAGLNNVPWRLQWNNSSYQWQQVPDGSYNIDPGAVSAGWNQVSLFARGMDQKLYHKLWNGSWNPWESLDGSLTSGPDASSWSLR